MALIDNKITTYVDNIKNLSDTPSDDGLTAQELKGYFDGRTDKEVKEKLNSLIDALIAYGVEKLVASIDIQKIKYIRLGNDNVLEVSSDGVAWMATGSSGHVIYDKDGNAIAQRSRMKFANSSVTDDGTYTIVNGIKGDTGATGVQGPSGNAASVQIGTVTQGAEGTLPTVINRGSSSAAVLDFLIPKGDKGAAWYPSLDALGNITFVLSSTPTPPPLANIRGPQGVQGVQGPQGATGPQGVQGPAGPTGLKGDVGIQGPQGIQGLKGDTGAKGDQGNQGERGPMGYTGSQGDMGPQGLKGDKGDTGDRGVQGIQGNVGPQGPQGPQGVQGIQGSTGLKGDAGSTGSQGPKGDTGAQGPMGPQGLQGIAGINGNDFTIQDIYATLAALTQAYPTGNNYAYKVTADSAYIFGLNCKMLG